MGTQGHDHGALLDRLTTAFTAMVGAHRLTPGFALLALLVAVVLGAAHALAPGHGKVMMATYLVAGRGAVRQAATLAATVALTHTAGTLLLGIVLAGGLHFASHGVYALLTAVSGLLVAGVGVSLLRRAYRTLRHGPRADHEHEHEHGLMRGRGVVAMGLAGGLAPSPSAVVVLLGAVGLGRAWFGVLLVAGYGVGMAVTLVGLGLLLTRMRAWLERVSAYGRGRSWLRHRAWRLVPLFTSATVVVIGLGVATRALAL
ncbi:HoxN/HupN/NixA family nickel/cobalt transporter [Catellatospora tritici]|uniref:HoxN/HupN/NixA family nickel/cobalt transporter n=1 Tax=Catellatospora tritici TaxID=2851566 RepID=UPI0020C1C046|nr:hypothetical protein [Catellatospora tritici]